MDIRIRRTITIAFFLFFFIVSPLLLLYASGYRYDFKRGTLLRTGNIFIEATDVKDATVYIDNKPYSELLNKKLFLKNLTPGDYTIRIEKEGYTTWEKKLRVDGTLTTFLKDVVLFLTSKPVEITKGPITDYLTSPDHNFISFIRTTSGVAEIWLYNTRYNEEQLLYRTSADLQPKMSWAKSSNRLMLILPNRALIYKTSSTPFSLLADIIMTKDVTTVWDETSDSTILLFGNEQISRYDLVTKKTDIIFETNQGEKISDIRVTNGSSILALIESDNNTSALLIDNSIKVKKEIFSVSGIGIKIIENTAQYLILSNKNTHKLYLVRKSGSNPLENLLSEDNFTLDGVSASLSPDKTRLLIINDYELSIFNIESKEINLINRFGQPIINAQWYDDSQHVMITVNDSVTISDLNIQSQKAALVTIMKADKIFNAELLNGQTVIVHGQLDDINSLYSIKIR